VAALQGRVHAERARHRHRPLSVELAHVALLQLQHVGHDPILRGTAGRKGGMHILKQLLGQPCSCKAKLPSLDCLALPMAAPRPGYATTRLSWSVSAGGSAGLGGRAC
jgi:hypothetical protein